jgi:hypothetical protein
LSRTANSKKQKKTEKLVAHCKFSALEYLLEGSQYFQKNQCPSIFTGRKSVLRVNLQ